jgi:predicted phosphodiesterase
VRYGVFSDVHSNLEALEAVLGFFEDLEVDGYICCGDLVGYGPEPDACLSRIRGLKNLALICGNHDLAAIGRIDVDWFNPYARAAALWTRDAMSADSRAFLEGLTARLDKPGFTMAHGTPRRPPEEYLMSAAQFRDNIEYVKVWPLFVGHSHMPVCFRTGPEGIDTQFLESHQEIDLPREGSTFLPCALNPGSVGQPRDHDRRASCGVFDSERGTFRIVRLDYDVAAVQAKIRAAGLPEYLALRLAYGQ